MPFTLTLPGFGGGGGSPPPPPAPDPVPSVTDTSVQDAAKDAASKRKKRRGRNTILTAPGLGDVEANVDRKKLLGG